MKLARLLCSIFLLSGCVSAFVSSSLDDRQISDPKSVMSALNQRRAQCRSKIQIDAIRRTLEWFDKYSEE